MQVTTKDGFYTVQLSDHARHFLTAWETIQFLSNLINQKN